MYYAQIIEMVCSIPTSKSHSMLILLNIVNTIHVKIMALFRITKMKCYFCLRCIPTWKFTLSKIHYSSGTCYMQWVVRVTGGKSEPAIIHKPNNKPVIHYLTGAGAWGLEVNDALCLLYCELCASIIHHTIMWDLDCRCLIIFIDSVIPMF